MMRLGITATVPVEIILAAGLEPLDLNNLFITSPNPSGLVELAEDHGFSHGICSWIKGIYGAVIGFGIKNVLAVTGGDCSNTIALAEVLSSRGVEVSNFAYPLSRERMALDLEMDRFEKRLSVTREDAEKAREALRPVRRKLSIIDELTYREDLVTGLENHLFLVRSSDFGGNPHLFEKELDDFIVGARMRTPVKDSVRLGYLGVPPIFSGFYEHIESLGARVVYNEVQRQFSMPFAEGDIVDQYISYTYPYSAEGRIADINQAIQARSLDGLIHYTQTFCYRQIYDIILRNRLPVPVLTLEGEKPGPIDGRTALRIETFIEMLRAKKLERL